MYASKSTCVTLFPQAARALASVVEYGGSVAAYGTIRGQCGSTFSVVFWIVAALALVAFVFPFIAPLFY